MKSSVGEPRLLDVRPWDSLYAERLLGALPNEIIDVHTHVWLSGF